MKDLRFLTALHPELFKASKQVSQDDFFGYSYFHFNKIREKLDKTLSHFNRIPLRKADYMDYSMVHTKDYLEKLLQRANGKEVTLDSRQGIDCKGLEYLIPGYQYYLGMLMEAIDRMKAGMLDRAYFFGMGGHHAHPNWGHGYCLLNSTAAAAKYALSNGFSKILIIDWDIHHGDGTQEIFSKDDNVYCISIHSAIDLYMNKAVGVIHGTTTYGEKSGNCNIPLLDQFFEDNFFEEMELPGKFYRANESISIFEEKISDLPWKPDLIFIFSGYDSHKNDCGAGITNWGNEDFKKLTRMVCNLSEKISAPIISCHGGGYTLDVAYEAALAHIEEFSIR